MPSVNAMPMIYIVDVLAWEGFDVKRAHDWHCLLAARHYIQEADFEVRAENNFTAPSRYAVEPCYGRLRGLTG